MRFKIFFCCIFNCLYSNSLFSQITYNEIEDTLSICDEVDSVEEIIFIPEEFIEKRVSDIPYIEFNESRDINPIVRQLGDLEKSEIYTPASVAYNFVQAILNEDMSTMLHLSTEQFKEIICYQYDDFITVMHQHGKLNLFGWKTLPKNYEIVPLLVQAENEDSSVQKVYMACIPSSEINVKRFQNVTRDGETNVKVLVNNYSGHWLVDGFK